LDVKSMFKAQSVGASVTMLATRAVPASDASGFDPSRDLDEITAGAYSLEGVDVAAVLRGRFDVQKINAAADAQVAASASGGNGGTLFVKSSYADHTLYTVSNAGFCTLTSRTLLAGTETGIRRMLDKIRDKKIGRELDPTMAATLSPPTAAATSSVASEAGATSSVAPIVFAANFHATPVPNIAPVPWLRALDSARVLANFDDPGLNVAGRLSFPDGTAAQAGSDGLKGIGTLANFAAAGGLVPQIQNLDVKIVQNDVTVKFAVDDDQLRSFLAKVARYVPQH
jgi:hypothetical protein